MFLRQIAARYTAPGEIGRLGHYCFVFPNRRSSLFFRRYLLEEFDRLGQPAFIPTFTTISDLVARYSHGAGATRNELLFALYDSYKKVLRKHNRDDQIRDFDRFRFWGDLILNDFNDVDRYDVDAETLFTNVSRLKEISADYLTPEQRAIVNRFWGDADEDLTARAAGVDVFWLHTLQDTGKDDSSVRARFISLWEILYDLYSEFRYNLSVRGLNYPGMAYREAAESLRGIPAGKLPYERYIFVGFNVLSTCELIIFDRLRDIGAADFYWDFAAPAFFNGTYPEVSTTADIRADMINFNNRATRFVGRNLLRFPSRYPLDVDLSGDRSAPQIDVLAVPGNTAQTKEVERILDAAVKSGDIHDPADAIDTCVVVNDESLFVPLLHSVPETIGAVNITLGLPKRHTTTAAFMSAIIMMHTRARVVSGNVSYFFEDVLAVLNHPMLLSFASEDSFSIRTELIMSHSYMVPANYLCDNYPALSFIFTDIGSYSADEVYVYICSLLDTVVERLVALQAAGTPFEGSGREIDIISDYRRSVEEIDGLRREYGIEMAEGTYFRMIESMMNSSTLNFAGMPLRGLQIMSMLETRTLDFDNLIMLSMNERIFPRKHYAGTFIPNALRSGYGMSTIDHQESIFAYYFYRLLTRARRVSLIYDSRTSGISSGEMSRYLYQLKYLHSYSNVTFRTVDYMPSSPLVKELTVSKNPDELKEFLDGGSLCLSASALKTFSACPLKFYLQYVRRWNADDDIVKEYMTPITYGNVIHHVVQKLFEYVRGDSETVTITADLLEKLKTMHAPGDPITTFIDRLICEEINAEFHNRSGDGLRRPLRGQSRLLADIMAKTVRGMLDAEKAFAPFDFFRAEYGGMFVWKLAEDLRVRFRMSVDRVDIISGGRALRFIDYKTGSDGVYSGAMETLADRGGEHEYGAVFQLMTYAMAYTDCFGDNRPVQPYIYKLGKVMSEGLVPVRVSRTGAVITSHLDWLDKFRPGFIDLVRRIFDPDEPFTQCPVGDMACRICRFADMCGRVVAKTNR